MKFTNGLWLTRRGYRISRAGSVYELCERDGKLLITATPNKIYGRGQTLGGPILELEISAPAPDVICISAAHFTGGAERSPEPDISAVDFASREISFDGGTVELRSGKMRALIGRDAFNIDFYCCDRYLTSCRADGIAYIAEEQWRTEARRNTPAPEFFDRHFDARSSYMRGMLELSVGEYIYGLGERFTPFVKNGQSVEMWNSDGGTCSEQSYKNIPFYVSSRGYGVFVASFDPVEFEVGSENVSRTAFTVPGEKMKFYITAGETPLDAVGNYALLTGRPALPPAWSFGLWLTTSFTTNYDEATALSFIDGMESRGIPLSVFHFDCFWMKAMHWCDFEWDNDMFPDPEGMLARLHERGLKVCVWINPYISQKSALFKLGAERGYFIRHSDGSVYQTDMWQPGMAILDFTNPDACEWYASHLRRLCEMGVDCFKTDFGERIPDDSVYYDGSSPIPMHNYYTFLYNKVVFDVLRLRFGDGNACLFARSATAGSQQLPVHWGGDCSANYSSMAEVLRGCLSLSASGFGFVSHDIGGFEDTATPDIYKRWLAFGMLSSHSRLHGSSSYRVPWMFGEEASSVAAFFVNLKGRLMPYIWTAAYEAHERGIPVMRPMALSFPQDKNCLPLDRQYMLGGELLAAPIFNCDGIAEFYLPDTGCDWYDIITNEKYPGGRWITKKCGYFEIPALVRRGTVLPFGSFSGSFDYDFTEDLELVAYGIFDGESVRVPLRGRNGAAIELVVTRVGDSLQCEARFDNETEGSEPVIRSLRLIK